LTATASWTGCPFRRAAAAAVDDDRDDGDAAVCRATAA